MNLTFQKRVAIFPFLYLLGFWCCFLFHPYRNDVAYEGTTSHPSPTSSSGIQNCTEPVIKEAVIEENVPCDCSEWNTDEGAGHRESDLKRENIWNQAIPCVDQYASSRMPSLPPTEDMVIAQCAMRWLEEHATTELDVSEPKILMDYSYDGMQYPLPNMTSPNWVYLTAFLPQKGIQYPPTRMIAGNQLLMAPPTHHRVRSLMVTNTLFDVQLVLRVSELLDVLQPLDLHSALGRIIGMSRVTYTVLPCQFPLGTNASGVQDAQILKDAARAMVEAGHDLGIHQLDIEVQPLVSIKYNTCVKELFKISPIKIHRGVRLKWCYYPLGTKYDLIYRKGDMVQLVHRYVMQWTRAGGDKVKTIRKWHPSINMGDVLGWGLDPAQREVLFWDILTQPSCPDPAIQNWLLTEGGRVLRIDPNQQSWKGKHPEGQQYVEFMKIFLCVERNWKQKFDEAVKSNCLSCQGGMLMHASEDGQWKFYHNLLHAMNSEGKFVPHALEDAVQKNLYPECPSCKKCVMHSFRILKLFWHNEVSLPPPSCHECYRCQRKAKLGRGVSLDVSQMHGCTDVEAVGSDGTSNPDLCYDTQTKPIPRPSAPLEVVRRGFFS